MNRKLTNRIRYFLDECLPPCLRDSRWFMWPLFYFWFKGWKHRDDPEYLEIFLEVKSMYHRLTDEDWTRIYQKQDSMAKDRPTDLSPGCVDYILQSIPEETSTVCDVGCGMGFLARLLVKKNLKVTGVDLIDKHPGEGIDYHKSFIYSLPFEDKSFDVVTCNHVLEHIVDLDRAVSELKRVAKKRLIITVPCQRYYYFTLDLHLNFFPTEAYLLSALKLPQATASLVEGDWVCVADLQ